MTLSQTDQHTFPFQFLYYIHYVIYSIFIGRSRDIARKEGREGGREERREIYYSYILH